MAKAVLTRIKFEAIMTRTCLSLCFCHSYASDCVAEAEVWVRALQSDTGAGTTWSTSTLSRAWRDLEDMGLIAKKRE
ncbi:hypothetical protein, partial [Microbacterium sp.]|uniref:hypothetical protein n=1 Tax=Microbacterium sp. TaxID=51671 RepID=UPI003C2A4CC7